MGATTYGGEPHARDDGAKVPGSRGRPADGAHLTRGEHGLPAPGMGLFLEHKDALNATLMLLDPRSLACLSVSAPALPDRGARSRSRMSGASTRVRARHARQPIPHRFRLASRSLVHLLCFASLTLRCRGPMFHRQLVSRTWHALAGDDRLWEPHCRADPICAKIIIAHRVKSGGWRRIYSNRCCVWNAHILSASLLTVPSTFLHTFAFPSFCACVRLQ